MDEAVLGSDSEDVEDTDLADFVEDLEVEEVEQVILDEKGNELHIGGNVEQFAEPAGNSSSAPAEQFAQPAGNSSSSNAPIKPVNEELEISRLIVKTIVNMAIESIKNDAKNKHKRSGEVDYNFLSQQSSGPTSVDVAHEVDNSDLVIAFDGEQFQIKAITEYCADEENNPHIQWFKLAAMCSNTSQPNDKMPSFRIIKNLTNKLYGKRHCVTVSEQPSPYFQCCTSLFNEVPKASRRTFLRFLQYLPAFLSNAYTIDHISSGWSRSGLYPYDNRKILEYWPRFSSLSESESEGIIDSPPALTRQGAAVGFLTDNEVSQEMEHFLPDDIFITTKDLQTYPINRWRAIWFNAEGTIARRKQRDEEIYEASKLKQKRKRQTKADQTVNKEKSNKKSKQSK